MCLACIHPLYARNQAASSSGASCASPPPSQAPPCVLPTVTAFTGVLAAQIARLAGSWRHNNRIPGRAAPSCGTSGHVASGPCRRLVVGARGMSSVHSRRPLPPGHHGRPIAAPRQNFLQAGWNHGKNHVPRVAIAWKAVQRNSAATRERLHQVWGGLDAPMMNDRLVLSALSFWPPAGTAENDLKGNEGKAFASR